jgi:hypothetical protein
LHDQILILREFDEKAKLQQAFLIEQ